MQTNKKTKTTDIITNTSPQINAYSIHLLQMNQLT